MNRVLIKGGSIPGFRHNEAEWDESTSIKDYNVVMLNLNNIIENSGELVAPKSGVPQSIEFPPVEDVVKLLQSGNRLFIFLPRTRIVDFLRVDEGETSKQEVDLLSWLPFKIKTSEESGSSVNIESVPSEWKWYFDGDFNWPMYISRISLKKDVLSTQTLFDRAVQHTIAETTFEEDIASKIVLRTMSDMAAELTNDIELKNTGSVYILPIRPDYTFDEVAAELLSELYEFSIETRSVPDWAQEKLLPRQREIIGRVQDLKSEFKRLNNFNMLLYEDGDELEEVVLDAFEELGFDVESEIPGKRDGVVLFDEKAFVLETHGTKNAIGVGKVDQLNRWVRNAREDFEDREVDGLLIANAYRDQKPENRDSPITGDPKTDLDEYGYRLLSTSQLYDFLRKKQRGELSKAEIKQKLHVSIS